MAPALYHGHIPTTATNGAQSGSNGTPRLRGCTTRSERRTRRHAPARLLRQGGQHPLHPLGVADVHQQQGEDHQRERGHLEHLGGDALKAGLQHHAEPLQQAEQVGAQGHPHRVPGAEDDDGEDDPAQAVQTGDGALPAGLDAEREHGTGQAHQRAAEHGVDVAERVDPGSPGERRRRAFAHRPQRQARPGAEDPPPGHGDEDEAEVGHDVVLEEQGAQDGDLLQQRGWDARPAAAPSRP